MKAEEVIPATHRLEHSGMTRNEAEAVVGEFQKVVAPLATKEDLSELGQSLRSEMKSMEESLRSNMNSMENSMATKVDLANMEVRLFRSLLAAMLGVGALALAILRFFPPP
ncbi:MAG: hypothetical protein F4234_01500 [Gammaproteobacteria bacterium]|nr:hypothetical protein [Gammaproteobacteria bacterium]